MRILAFYSGEYGLAAMGIGPDFDAALVHVSGKLLRANAAAQPRPYQPTAFIAPGARSDSR